MKTTAAGKRLLEHFAKNCDLDLSVSYLLDMVQGRVLCTIVVKILQPRLFSMSAGLFLSNWRLLLSL